MNTHHRPKPRRMRRIQRRPVRRLCLDLAHTSPESPCPYCNPDPVADDLVASAVAVHADLAAQDAEAWGWAA